MNTSHRRSTHAKQPFLQRLSTHKRLLIPAAVAILAGLGGGAYYLTKTEASPEERLAAAHKFEQAGDHKGAVIELKNVLQVAPTNAEARFLLGRVHYANNDFLNAEKEFRKAQNAGYKQPDMAYILGRTLLVLRQPGKIMEEIHEIPGASPADNAAILAIRAHAQLLLGDKAGTEKALNQADALLPEHPDTLVVRAGVAHTQGQTVEALALIDKALAKAAQRADLWVMKGDLLRTAGKFPEAMAAYAKATSIDPGNLPARLASAQYYVSTAALDKAEVELKALQTVAPNNLMGRYFGALIDFRRKQYDAANNKLQEVLRGAPDFTPANLLAGIINIRLGKHENAITHLNRVLEQVPAHPLARKLLASTMMETGQFGRAKELIANLDNDDNDALLLSLRGNLALQAGAYQEARHSLEKASALAPDDQNLIRGIAASRMASGDEAGAIAALTQLSEKDGKSHQADVLLVLTHVKAKRYDEALKVIDKLSSKNPRLALAENLRGAVYVARNEIPQAQQSFLKALEYDPGYLPAASNLARIDLSNKDIKSARSRFTAVLKQNPGSARAMTALAELAALEKNEPEYLKYAEQAIKAEPKNLQARRMIVRYWLLKRDAGKALVAARAAKEATGSPEFLEQIGAAQMLQGDAASALSTYGQWTETSPNNPLPYFRLAQLQQHEKNTAAALKSLDKALTIHPDFAEASMSKAMLLAQSGKPDEGIKIARALQAKHPKAVGGILAEADILAGTKKYADAGKLYIKATQMTGQGQFLIRANQVYKAAGQAAEGEKQLDLWIKAHPEDTPVRHALAQNLLDGKHLKEAADHYRVLVKANPSDLIANNNLAWLLGELKDPGALAAAEQTYKLAPKNAAVLDTYGWQLTMAGQAKRGLPYMREALGIAPDNPELRWHLAATLEKAGEKREATTELDRLLTSGKPFPQEAQARALLQQLRSSNH